MNTYIATFFTHFDAIAFSRRLRAEGVEAVLSPVPRTLSSSCGTCVRFSYEKDAAQLVHDELEQLVRVEGDSYVTVADNR